MRIYCLSHLDLVQRRRTTNRLADVRFCQGLARNGAEVELIVPYAYRRDNVPRAAVRAHYGVEEELPITTLPTPLVGGAPRWVRIPVWWVAILGKFLGAAARARGDRSGPVWISRDHNAIMAILLARRLTTDGGKAVYWAHEFLPEDRRIAWLYRNADGVLVTNSAIQEDLEAVLAVPRERTAVTLNPVSAEVFARKPDRRAARRDLSLDQDVPLVVYTGKLGVHLEEAAYILEAAGQLPEYKFVLTGGTPGIVEHWENRARLAGIGNVSFTGWLDRWEMVRKYQMAADVLVSYYTSVNKRLSYNHPQKIAEYMASGTPIVTVDARATRDILNAENAVFVEPHSAPALVAGIRRIVDDRGYARKIAERAYRDARAITLETRGREVLGFLERIGTEP